MFWSTSVSAQNLKVRSVEFPDSVNIGETALLKGYIVNATNANYVDLLKLNIDIEDRTPANILLDDEVDQIVNLNQVNIAPNDSIYFEQSIDVTANSFRRGTVDLIIVWPQLTDNNENNVASKADLKLTYVKDENAITNPSNQYDFLPNDVLDFIYENYPGSTIEEVEIEDCEFEIELNTGEEIELPIYDCNEDDYSDDDDEGDVDDDDFNNVEEDNYGDDDYYDDNEGEESDDDDDGEESDDDDDEGEESDDDDDEGEESDDDDDEGEESDDDDDEGEESNDDDDEGEQSKLNARPLFIEHINNAGKFKNNTFKHFTIQQLNNNLVLNLKTGFIVNNINIYNLDGKMLLQHSVYFTNSYSLQLSNFIQKNKLIIVEVIGKNESTNNVIQQSQKVFVSHN